MLVKNRNFRQKSKILTKIKMLVKNLNCGQKSKVWWKIEILVKNGKFGQTSKFWSTTEILVKFWRKKPWVCSRRILATSRSKFPRPDSIPAKMESYFRFASFISFCKFWCFVRSGLKFLIKMGNLPKKSCVPDTIKKWLNDIAFFCDLFI